MLTAIRRASALIHLGYRFGRAERLSRAPAIAQAVASFVVVGALLVSFGVWNVVMARQFRIENRHPVAATEGAGDGALLAVRVVETNEGAFTLVSVADGEMVEAPPGLSQLPTVGQMIVSPAARGSPDPAVGSILHYRDTGTLDEAGLVAPDELVAYVGVERSAFGSSDEQLAARVSGFGGPVANDLLRPDLVGFYRAFGALVLLVGFGSVVRGAVRVSETLQLRRLFALGAMGLTPTELRFVSGTRAAIWSSFGALSGVAVFHLFAATLSSVPFTSWTYFREDIVVGPYLSALVLGGTPLIAAAISALPMRDAAITSSRVKTWRLVIIPTALTAMATVLLLPQGTGQRLAWWATSLLMVVAVGLGTGGLISVGGRTLERSAEPAIRLAGRRLQARPAAYARLFAPIGLMLLIGVSAVPIAEATGARYTQQWLEVLADNSRRIVAIGTPSRIDFDRAYVTAAVPTLVTHEDGEPAGPVVIVADCGQLDAMRVTSAGDCPIEPALVTDASGASVFDHGDVTVHDAITVTDMTIEAPKERIALSAHELEQLEGRIVVTPDMIDIPINQLDRMGYIVVTDTDAGTLRRLEADVMAADPTATVISEIDEQIGQTRALVPVSMGVRLATAVLCILLLLAVSVAVMNEAFASARTHAPLKALGVPDSFTTRSFFDEMTIAAIITALAAVAGAALTVHTLTNVWRAPPTSITTVVAFAAITGAAMTATALCGIPFLRSPLHSDTLNQE